MKKLLFLFVFLPFAAYAKKCDFCKEMASEMCQDKGLKLLGDDECIECCKKGQGYSDVAIKGSPSWWEYQGSYLVPNGKHKCCDGSTFTYISHNPENGKAVNIKQCCNSGSTHACDLLDRGQTISIDGTCFCGCWNDYDCRGLSWQAKYHCSSNHRCMAPEDIDISGIFVQIQDFAGGKITSEKVQRLVEKIRQDFLKSTGNDKLKIVFKGQNSDGDMVPDEDGGYAMGYSPYKDKLMIVVNSGICQYDKAEELIACEATLVHENVHRVDNVVQPVWYQTRKRITHLYQSLLTEIHAQTVEALYLLREFYENCYSYSNGEIEERWITKEGEKPDPNLRKCGKMEGTFGYLRNFISEEYAKEYYNNKSWLDYDNCNGLAPEIEEAFISSTYARTAYVKNKKEAAKEIAYPIHADVKEAILKLKDASFMPGFGGMVSRLNWKWNSKPSPALVSDIAALYSENATLCMTPERFMNHPAIKLGFEHELNLNELEEIYDFLSSNPQCGGISYLSEKVPEECQKVLDCVTDEWQKGCWPVLEWLSHVGEIETYTIE